MANLAPESDAVEPMRKDYRTHALPFRSAIQHHIRVLRRGLGHGAEKCSDDSNRQGKKRLPDHFGGTAPAGIAIGRVGFGIFSPGLETL